jgi:hypothetical protein
MEKILVEDILPVIIVMALGFVCGKLHYFDSDQRQGLNKLVLNIALPAALFVSIVRATREMLARDLALTALAFVGIAGMFLLAFVICRTVFKHNTQEAAVCALITGSPTIGFLGFAVLDPIYGNSVDTNLVIAIASIVVNVVTIPLGMFLVNLGQSKMQPAAAAGAASQAVGAGAQNAEGASNPASAANSTSAPLDAHLAQLAITPEHEKQHPNWEVFAATADRRGHVAHSAVKNQNRAAFVNALKQPICWAPLVAILLVLLGVKVPTAIDPTFELIAKANSGVAVLAAGLALSTVKFAVGIETLWNTAYRLLITPAVVLALGMAVGLGSHASMTSLSMLVLAVALPPAFSGVIISSRYNIYVKEGMSTTAVATVAFAATCLLWLFILHTT